MLQAMSALGSIFRRGGQVFAATRGVALARPRFVPFLQVRRHFAAEPSNTPAPPSASELNLKDPWIAEAKKQLDAGNPAEAYGLSPEAGAIGDSGLWDKYSVVATAGLFAVAAFSKEWIIMNEELTLLQCFLASVTAGYIGLRESVAQHVKEEQEAYWKALNALYDLEIDNIEEQLQQARAMAKIHDDFKTFLDSYYASVAAIDEAAYPVPLIKLRREMEEYCAKHDEKASAYRKLVLQDFIESSVPWVRAAYQKLPDKYKQQVVESAILQLRMTSATRQMYNPIIMRLFALYAEKVWNPDLKKIAHAAGFREQKLWKGSLKEFEEKFYDKWAELEEKLGPDQATEEIRKLF